MKTLFAVYYDVGWLENIMVWVEVTENASEARSIFDLIWFLFPGVFENQEERNLISMKLEFLCLNVAKIY